MPTIDRPERIPIALLLCVVAARAGDDVLSPSCVTHCHGAEQVAHKASVHADALACVDCHGGDPSAQRDKERSHDPAKGFLGKVPRTKLPELCGSCHSDPQKMHAYGLATDPLAQYRTSVHGQALFEKGDENVAVCTDCHGVHGRLNRVCLAMGANFGDLDNDGWLDFYLGTGQPDLATLVPNRMFRNAGGRFFQEVTTSGGFGHLQKGHGIAFGALDNDGDIDIIVSNCDGPSYFIRNEVGNRNNWLSLELRGVKSNRTAIGAKVKVNSESGQVQYNMVSTTASYLSANDHRVFFGLVGLRRKSKKLKSPGLEGINKKFPNQRSMRSSKLKKVWKSSRGNAFVRRGRGVSWQSLSKALFIRDMGNICSRSWRRRTL